MKIIGLTQRVEILKDRNERRDCLDQQWTNLLLKIGMLPVPLPNCVKDVEAMVLNLRIEGVILTGGNDLAGLSGAENIAPERDKLENELLNVCCLKNIPVLGVCRGFQMMVAHYGGKLVPVNGHTAISHGVAVQGEKLIPLSNRDSVNSFHNFGVKERDIGRGLAAVALAPDGTVEAIAHKQFPQWGIMWHPERQPYDEKDAVLIKELFK
ncbi:MAG: gamma-glutamyl-gamma-aminobutyrate hydrolase family protein [Candidatus Auribacterota bacterium]|nr:gamma-glutamyl-gamma-aminobutyrate hydrolase family protein [Candidatus Auribacterota bacterium]